MVDLREPRPIRVLMLNAAGEQVGEVVIGDDEPVVSPEQGAHMALHADDVTRVQVYDLAGNLLLDRTESPDGHGYLDA